MSLQEALVLVVASAILTHLYLRNFEPEPKKAHLVLLGIIVVPCLDSVLLKKHVDSILIRLALASSVYWSALSLSIVLYRISPWHPLAKFPGPRFLYTSKLLGAVLAKRGDGHLRIKKLHDEFGPIVRIGPNEISVVDVSALSPILGADGMPKGPMWDGRRPPNGICNIEMLRDPVEHLRRRKVWNRAFTTNAVKDYEEVVVKRSLQLLDALVSQSANGGSIDLTKWYSYFTFDIMGDMLFGGGFEFIRDGDRHGIMDLMTHTVVALSMIQHLPWFVGIYEKLPITPAGLSKFREFAMKCVKDRRARGAVTKDVFHYIMNEDGVDKVPLTLPEVLSDAGIAVVAGSDTTSSTMTVLFYYLLSNPSAYKRLREEINSAFPIHDGHPFDASKLSSLPYLNAVINEALRLQPPVPVYLQRAPQAGSGGRWVASQFIPEGTAVDVAPYALHRDPRYFSPHPDEFIPERWLKPTEDTETKFTTNMLAFIPFSMGPSNCVGKNLAMLEMRMVTALLVQQLDMKFGDGFNGEKWEENIEEYFVIKPPPLPIQISRTVSN
ncbi:cytochrome P450 [Schizopora paradoxa]|uniref:Cytochrome P450 n=1 Tax=Schizopora paradoxa TaxID=27342 RepID=A0A0H2RGM4_9AGAM|nr:cytochrome P450 [Schizopora paradoxa]